jgi:hypothetical protein
MTTNKKVIINLILEGKDDENNTDYDKFIELKDSIGVTKPNTEIIKNCIRATHKLLIE